MPSPVSRRQFLGAAATLAAAPLVLRADDLPSRKITVGVMGLGRGLSLAQTFARQPGVTVKYLCDVDDQRAGRGAAALEKSVAQKPDVVSDFRRILDDPEIDALICAAPNHWHAPATILACSAGKHVYVEKPCSHNPWEGETMVAARKHNRIVQLGTQRRSSPHFQEAVAKIHDGLIGKVHLARAWYNNLRESIGVGQKVDPPAGLNYELWQGPAPRLPYFSNRIPYNWHWFWHYGNGELGNNGIHALDICRWGLDVNSPSSVTSSGGRYWRQDDQQTPDTHVAAYEFPGGKQVIWQGLSCNKHKDSGGFVTFYGEGGALELDWVGGAKLFDTNDNIISQTEGELLDAPHIDNFLSALRNDDHQQLHAEIEIGHKSTLMCHLGNIAYRTQHALRCELAEGHILNDAEAEKLWKREYAPGWEPVA